MKVINRRYAFYILHLQWLHVWKTAQTGKLVLIGCFTSYPIFAFGVNRQISCSWNLFVSGLVTTWCKTTLFQLLILFGFYFVQYHAW